MASRYGPMGSYNFADRRDGERDTTRKSQKSPDRNLSKRDQESEARRQTSGGRPGLPSRIDSHRPSQSSTVVSKRSGGGSVTGNVTPNSDHASANTVPAPSGIHGNLRTLFNTFTDRAHMRLRNLELQRRKHGIENNRKSSQSKFGDFPSLRDLHEKAERDLGRDEAELQKDFKANTALADRDLDVFISSLVKKLSTSDASVQSDGLERRLKEQESAWTTRFSELQASLSPVTERIAALEKENKTLKEQEGRWSSKFIALEKAMESASKNFATFQAENENRGNQGLAETVSRLDQRIAAIEAEANTFADHQTRLASLESLTPAIKKTVSSHSALGSKNIELQGLLEKLGNKMQTLADKNKSIDIKLHKLEQDAARPESNGKPQTLHGQNYVDNLTKQVNLLEIQQQEHASTLEGISNDDLMGAVEGSTMKLPTLQVELDKLQREVANLARVPRQSPQRPVTTPWDSRVVDELQKDIKSLRTSLGSLQQFANQMKLNNTKAHAQYRDDSQKLTSKLSATFGRMMDDLRKRMDTIESKHGNGLDVVATAAPIEADSKDAQANGTFTDKDRDQALEQARQQQVVASDLALLKKQVRDLELAVADQGGSSQGEIQRQDKEGSFLGISERTRAVEKGVEELSNGLAEICAKQSNVDVRINGLHHGLNVLDAQFKNQTTDELCQKIFGHIRAVEGSSSLLQSVHEQEKRLAMLEAAFGTKRDSDTTARKRKIEAADQAATGSSR